MRAASGPPMLHLVAITGHTIGVRGTGWNARDRIAFAVHYDQWTAGVVVRATRKGRFNVAADTIDLCGGVTFDARDVHGHHAIVHGPPLMCPSRTNPPRPTFTVTSGTGLQPRETRIVGVNGPRTVTVHVGEVVYLWLAGTVQPTFTPTADPKHLALLSEERTPPRACAQVDCTEGFAWQWMAIRTGDTGIDLSPACRLSTPPCGVPDLLIRVHVQP